MTFRQFVSARFAERRVRRVHKQMFRVYGESWARNAAGVVDLLSSPAPVYVVDAAMLDQAVRGAVAEALSGSAVAEEQAISTFSEEPVESYTRIQDSAAEPFPVVPAAEAESPPEDAIFEERSNGVAAVPVRQNMMYDDDRRRAFLRTFFQQGPVRGPVVPTR